MMKKTLTKVRSRKIRTTRIEARLSKDEKYVIEKAANLKHISVSDFIRINLVKSAEIVLEQEEVIRLNKEDSIKFIEALLSKSHKPSIALKQAFMKYEKAKESGIIKSEV